MAYVLGGIGGIEPYQYTAENDRHGEGMYSEVVSTKSKYQQQSQFLFFCLHIGDPFFNSCCDILLKSWALIFLPCLFLVPMINSSLKKLKFSGRNREMGLLSNPNQRDER